MSEVISSGYADLMDLRIAAKEYFFDAFNQYPMKFENYFDVVDMGDGLGSFLKSSELGGVGEMSVVGESSAFPEVTPVEGYDATLTPLKYAAQINISLEAQQDDPKGIFNNVQKQITLHYKGAQQTACKLAATVLNTGDTVAGPDGQYLFDTDHPTSPANATTLSNLITTKMDSAGMAIKEMIVKTATNGKDLAGNQIDWGRFLVVVPPALGDNAIRSCQAMYGTQFTIATSGAFSGIVGGIQNPSPLQTGELLNAVLSQSKTPATVVVDPFLGSGYSGGSDVVWYFIASPEDYRGTHSLRWVWRKRPQITSVTIAENGTIKIPFYMRCAAGPVGWRHAWASTGAA